MSEQKPRKSERSHDHTLTGHESALLFTAFFALALSIVSVFTI